jgi:RNA polymerase sigma factor (sigma-70 family)
MSSGGPGQRRTAKCRHLLILAPPAPPRRPPEWWLKYLSRRDKYLSHHSEGVARTRDPPRRYSRNHPGVYVNPLAPLVRREGMSVATATRLDLEAFVASEYPRVVAAVRLITGDRDGAPDAVQDALVGLIANPPRTEPSNVAAYVTVVASNRLRDAQRRRGAEKRAYDKLPPQRPEATDALSTLDVDVHRALVALPARQREICVMHYLLDHSVDHIAAALGVSAGTVKTQLHRARATLAATLGKEADDE